MVQDLYDTLGVAKNASEDEIKKAYRKLSMKYHPDMQAGKSDTEKASAEEKFKEINNAYTILSDKDKRANYDQFGSADGPQNMGSGFGFDDDMMDVFARMHERMGGGFGGPRKRRPPKFDDPERGRNVRVHVDLLFKEAVQGVTKTCNITLTKPCKECSGTGVKPGSTPVECQSCHGYGQKVHTQRTQFGISQTITECPECHGTGYKFDLCPHCHGAKRVPDQKKFEVKIPAGVDDGQQIVQPGFGHCGVCGGADGDLILETCVQHIDDLFQRDGNDIYTIVHVDPIDAILGKDIEVITPYRKESIKLPKGITSGKTIRIKNGGIKSDKYGTGDLYVNVVLDTYSNLSPEQEKILTNFQKNISNANLSQRKEYMKRGNDYLDS